MSPRDKRRGVLFRAARRFARAATPSVLQAVLEEELDGELDRRRALGQSRLRRELWAAGQFVVVGARVAVESVRDDVSGGAVRAWLRGDGWLLDLRHAARALATRPTTTTAVMLTIALAVGATTSVFSVVDGVLLRPLPYPDSDRLARIWQTTVARGAVPEAAFRSADNQLAPLGPSFEEWLDLDLGFTALGAYVDAGFVLQLPEGATALRGQEATSGFFEALGIEPVVGRRLVAQDDLEGAPPVVVISEGFWRDHYGTDPSAVGRSLALNGVTRTVVGVMPDGFDAPSHGGGMLAPGAPASVWIPLTGEARRGWKNVSVLGRLQDGVPLGVASDRLSTAAEARTAIYDGYESARAESLLESVVGDVRTTLLLLLSAVGFVLLVALVNVANLLAAAGLGRQRELALRAALGAGRGRLAVGRVLESVLLALGGAVGGVWLAKLTLPLLVRLVPPDVPRQEAITIGPSVLLFGIALAAATAVVIAVVQVLAVSAAAPQATLRESSSKATASTTARRLRSALVITEVSLASALFIGAVLLGRSYLELAGTDRGFSTDGLVALRVVPDRATAPTEQDSDAFALALAEAIEARPAMRATVANQVPLAGGRSATEVYLERPEGGVERLDEAVLTVALDNYFDVIGIPLLHGRGFGPGDGADGPPVVMVNAELARRYGEGGAAIGQRLRTFDDSLRALEIVGIVGDVRHEGLAVPVAPSVFLPHGQSNRETNEVVVRTDRGLDAAMAGVRETVKRLSPATPVRRVTLLDQSIADSIAVPRYRASLLIGLSTLALILTVFGVYGVIAQTVAQSRREIGVRLALGADAPREVRRVVGRGLRLGGVGVAIGLALAWALSGWIRSFLFGVAPTDTITYALAAAGLLAVTGVAALLPARAAARIEPAEVLRGD